MAPAFLHPKSNKTNSVFLNAEADWLECDEADSWSKRLPAHFSAGMKCQRFSCGHRLHLAKNARRQQNRTSSLSRFQQMCVHVGVWEMQVCDFRYSAPKAFLSPHFSFHPPLCFSPPNLWWTHSFTFNVLSSCQPECVLFPAHSVMSPAFPSMASLCLFLFKSFLLLPLKLQFRFLGILFFFTSYTYS